MNRDIVLRVVSGSVTTDLDIDSNIPLRLDISSLENDKIGRVFGIGSQTFDLPGTKINNKFFKNANDPGSVDTPALYEFLKAYLLLDGDTLIEGKFFLKEVIASDDGYITYKCQIVDQTIDFKTQLEGKFIAEADFSAYNHTYSGDAILDGFNNALVSGNVFYPLADYGTDESILYPTLPRIQVNGFQNLIGNIDCSGSRMGLQQWQPAIKAKSVVDVMFEQAGYNYVSDFITDDVLDTSPFKNLFLMPKSNEELGPVLSGSIDNTFLAVYSSDDSFPGVPTNSYAIYTASYDSELSDPSNNYETSPQPKYTAPTAGTYTLNAQVELTDCAPTGPGSGVVATLEVQVFNQFGTLINILSMGSRVFTNTFPAANATIGGSRIFSMAEGDFLLPKIEFFNYNTTYNGQAFSAVSGSDTFLQMTVAPSVYTGTTVKMNEQFNGDTKTSDILKGFIEQFNLILTPEYGTEKTIRIETFDTWMQQGEVVDWTQKYDTAKRISIKHPISEQNKTLQIGNAEDEDRFSKLAKDNEPNLQYGTIQVVSSNEVPIGTRKITTYFAPTIVGSLIQSGSVTEEGQPTFNLSGNSMFIPHLYKFSGNKQETFAFKPRLGYKLDNISAGPCVDNVFYFGDLGGTLYSASAYSTLANISALTSSTDTPIYNLHFDTQYPDYTAVGGTFQQNESRSLSNYETYWNNYIQGLYWDEARKLTLDLQFNPEEYKDIKLNNIIVIKNQRYRINKITGFNITYPDVCKVELLKEYPVYNDVTKYESDLTDDVYYYVIRDCDGGGSVGTTIPTGSTSAFTGPSGDPALPINTRISGSLFGTPQSTYKIWGYAKNVTGLSINSLTDLSPLKGCPTGALDVPCEQIRLTNTFVGDAFQVIGTDCEATPINYTRTTPGSETFCLYKNSWTVKLINSASFHGEGNCFP